MQKYALTVDKFVEHAAKWSPHREIVTAESIPLKSRNSSATIPASVLQLVQIESMPIAATGKIDKNRLRIDYAEQ